MADDMLWIFAHVTDPGILTLLLIGMVGGLGLDFLQQIVNVHWGGGLAVEFSPDVS